MQNSAHRAPKKLTVTRHANLQALPAEYEKTGEKEGSTVGGWYQKEGTEEFFYFKLYENSENARIEFIANRIYEKLGVRAATSELFIAGVDLWIASKKVAHGEHASKEEQSSNTEFKNGFIVDAYLGNWDVVGEFFDNIIKDEQNHLYRIDNGGCGPLRANGKSKLFSPTQIEEIDDMRNPKFHAGQVFRSLTEEDIAVQTSHLLTNLDDEFLNEVYASSGLSGPVGIEFLGGLLGRKRYLESRF